MISVVIPSLNQSDYIAECLDSVRGQTYKDWECIVVDQSTDSTPKVLEYYMSIDPRIKILYTKKTGIALNRNLGIGVSKGDYIAAMDHDDIMDEKRLELSLKTLQKGYDVVYSDYVEMDYRATVMNLFKTGVVESPKVTLEDIYECQMAPGPTIMARRKCFIEHPYRDLKLDDDHYMIASWYKAGYKFKKLRTPILYRRYHNAQEYRVNYGFYQELSKKIRKDLMMDNQQFEKLKAAIESKKRLGVDEIYDLVAPIGGWFDKLDMESFAKLKLPKKARILELGTHHGRSATVLRLLFPDAEIYTCDPAKMVEDEYMKLLNITYYQKIGYMLDWDKPLDLLFIDDDHYADTVRQDIWKYKEFVKKGGYIVCHDYFGTGVGEAVDELLPEAEKFKTGEFSEAVWKNEQS